MADGAPAALRHAARARQAAFADTAPSQAEAGFVERIDAVVVGAGAVGLAVARALALRGRETIVLEAGPGIGNGIQLAQQRGHPRRPIRHSRVAQGDPLRRRPRALYPYCESRGVGHRRCGELVVAATSAQVEDAEGDRG
jgi:glycine/D-amino acid oxidase-like deaminating enzyme